MNEFEILTLLNDCTDCVYALSSNYDSDGHRWDVIDVFEYRRGRYDECVFSTGRTPIEALLQARKALGLEEPAK